MRVDDRVRPPQTSCNVRHWLNGEMALRWTAAGMLEAEQQFHRIIGYRDLAIAIELDRAANRVPGPTREEAARLIPA